MNNSFLTPQAIIQFIKSTADIRKIGLNLINSEQAKSFIQNELGKNYQQLKTNLLLAYNNTENSTAGLKKAQQLQYSKKLQLYKEVANRLIQKHGLSFHSAVILAGGFVGIQQNKVVQFLNSKGYTATTQFVQKYYNNNQNFLKKLMKKDNVIVPGWNDQIISSDLELGTDPKTEQLVPVPDQVLDVNI